MDFWLPKSQQGVAVAVFFFKTKPSLLLKKLWLKAYYLTLAAYEYLFKSYIWKILLTISDSEKSKSVSLSEIKKGVSLTLTHSVLKSLVDKIGAKMNVLAGKLELKGDYSKAEAIAQANKLYVCKSELTAIAKTVTAGMAVFYAAASTAVNAATTANIKRKCVKDVLLWASLYSDKVTEVD